MMYWKQVFTAAGVHCVYSGGVQGWKCTALWRKAKRRIEIKRFFTRDGGE
jgi:hypothetical protein